VADGGRLRAGRLRAGRLRAGRLAQREWSGVYSWAEQRLCLGLPIVIRVAEERAARGSAAGS
jgi:hypothetical protein